MTSSEVWNHFTKVQDKDMVVCSHCDTTLRRRDSSTKSLWGHLNSKHRDLGTDVFDKKRKRRVLPKSTESSEDLAMAIAETKSKRKRVRKRNTESSAAPSMVLSPRLMDETFNNSINYSQGFTNLILVNPINLEVLKPYEDENLPSTSSWSNSPNADESIENKQQIRAVHSFNNGIFNRFGFQHHIEVWINIF